MDRAVLLSSALLFLDLPARAQDGDPPPPMRLEPAGEVLPPPQRGLEPAAQSHPTNRRDERRFSDVVDQEKSLPSPMWRLGPLDLDLHARFQVLFGLTGEDASTDNGDTLSRDGFRVRRARLGASGRLFSDFRYSFEIDLVDEDSGGDVLLEAFAEYHPVEFAWIRAGAQKPPFSRLLIDSAFSMQFIERPLWVNTERAQGAALLQLERQAGVLVGGALSLFTYELGVFNGSPGFSTGNQKTGLLYALRLTGGVGEDRRSEADLSRGPFQARLGLNGYLNHAAAAEIRGAGADLAIHWAGLAFFAEVVWAKALPANASDAPIPVRDEVERFGMVAQVGYLLPIDFLDLEPAVRFALMDDQVHIADAGDAFELTAGLNVYLRGQNVKAMLNYVHREERHGPVLENDLIALMLQLGY